MSTLLYKKNLKELCSPAYIYFILSIISLLLLSLQNLSNTNIYYVGNYSCNVPHTIIIFIAELIYIIFWTWILNLMCKDGHSGIAWFIMLIPFILFFTILGIMILYL